MKRALIITVGTGTRPDVDITRPLIKTIKDSNPDFVGFIVSKESQPNAIKIIEDTRLSSERYEISLLESEDDLQKIFQTVNRLIRSIQARGFCPDDIVLDYTSGTKAMTGGAVLSAIHFSCGSLKYISGQRRGGIVIDDTEKFISFSPKAIFSHSELNLAKEFILEMRFESALRILSNINPYLLDDYEKTLREDLNNIALAYSSWDKFDHRRFKGYYEKVDFSRKETERFKVERTIPLRLIEVSQAIENGRITEWVLADLFNNARRRLDEGKYDDALGRLYRLTEMLAQWRLKARYDIDTGNVVLDKIKDLSPAKRDQYESLRDQKDGKIKLGMVKSYELLCDLHDPLGSAFKNNKRLQGVLSERHKSILAHGTKPITKEACDRLIKEVRNIIAEFIPDFNHKIDLLDFPWR
jgi:CRISPR-associated protein (TIGR02710 family)